jgi:putative redox protein
MIEPVASMDEAVAEYVGPGTFQTRISTAGTHILADEPLSAGGQGTGPTPYQLLAGALAACTTMTLRLYVTRKDWPVHRICTTVGHARDAAGGIDVFHRRLEIEGELDEAQRTKLLEMADRCPVHRTLTGGARVETSLGTPPPAARPATSHMADMEALIAVGRGSFDFVS